MFFLIFLSAALFRITHLNLIEFKADEAINLLLSSRPVFGYPLPPGGTISSLGVLNPPFFNYLLIPITFFSQDPKIVTFFIGLVNAIAVALLYLIVYRYYGKTIGLIFGLLFAFSPWAILYSRKIWMQDLIIPFFVPVFYSLHKLVIEKKTIYWLPYTVFSLFLIQLHQINFVFIALMTLVILLQKIKINLKYLIIGVAIGIVPLIPYINFELNNNCLDCSAIISAKEKLNTKHSLEIFLRPFQILSQGNFRFILGDDTLTLAQQFPTLELGRKLFYFEYLLLPLGIFIFFKRFKDRKFFIFPLILLPLIYFFLKLETFMHYFIIAIPFLFLFLAVGFDYFVSNKITSLKILGRVLVSVTIIVSLVFNSAFFELLKTRGYLKGDYGSAYYNTEVQAKNKISDFEKNKDFKEIYLSSFIPLAYLYGYQPLGKILYGETDAKRSIELEDKLIANSKDPRVVQELFAFYTREKTNLKNLDTLRIKALNIPQYKPLYEEVLKDYLYKNYKKEFESTKLGIRFFYPEHWSVEEAQDKILLEGDGKKFYLDRNPKLTGNPLLDDIVKTIRPL